VQSQLAEAEATLASSRATLVDRQINLFLALGGGWQDPAPAPKLEAAPEPAPARP
jgi:outer membrane protein TolC